MSLPAKAGLNFVKTGIRKTLKQDIEDFDIIYKHAEKEILIRVFNFKNSEGIIEEKRVFKYEESEKLFTIIGAMLKKELRPGREIVKAIISYSKLVVAMTTLKDGVKENKIIEL